MKRNRDREHKKSCYHYKREQEESYTESHSISDDNVCNILRKFRIRMRIYAWLSSDRERERARKEEEERRKREATRNKQFSDQSAITNEIMVRILYVLQMKTCSTMSCMRVCVCLVFE